MSVLHPTPRDKLKTALYKAQAIEQFERGKREAAAKLRQADVSRMASIEGSPEWQMMQPDEEQEP